MPAPYSIDLRERVLAALDAGMTYTQASTTFNVSVSAITRWRRRQRTVGAPTPRTSPGRPPVVAQALAAGIRQQVAAHPDATLAEHAEHWAAQTGQRVSTSSLSRALLAANLTRKKKSLIASERDPVAHAAFMTRVASLDPRRVVCLDEVGCHRNLTRLYARAPRGHRAVARVPRNRGRGISLIASLSLGGIGPTLTLDGGTGHADFMRYLDAVLLPTLAPGTTIVLDNLSAHRPKAVRERIEQAGCTVCYLPGYSPDLNPIELAFAALKAGMQRRGVRERAALADAMLEELAAITPEHAAAYFRHCGYTGHGP